MEKCSPSSSGRMLLVQTYRRARPLGAGSSTTALQGTEPSPNATPYATTSVIPSTIPFASYRTPTTACAPNSAACSHMRFNASSRASSHNLVKPPISPPTKDFSPAPMLAMAFLDRTVKPQTTPRGFTVRNPGRMSTVMTFSLSSAKVPGLDPADAAAVAGPLMMKGARAELSLPTEDIVKQICDYFSSCKPITWMDCDVRRLARNGGAW
mmetsp:Transcript_30498/g.65674  ORF Transcript_30498/g.65674 Transcript_30498/m.65674 type:complete len:210 (-) Transcript_30498:22-651(-)